MATGGDTATTGRKRRQAAMANSVTKRMAGEFQIIVHHLRVKLQGVFPLQLRTRRSSSDS